MKKLWKCPRCKREFAKENQTHSCRVYPLEEHFKNKDYAKSVFEYLKGKIEKEVGKLKIESLPCCIRLNNIILQNKKRTVNNSALF